MNRRDFLAKGLVVAGTTMLAGCRGFRAAEHRYELASESLLPNDIKSAPDKVREAYRFAIANRETLRYIPCYCGLWLRRPHEQRLVLREGQLNARESDIRSNEPQLRHLHQHTRDVMRMLDQGKPLKEIRTYVDRTYSRYGPPTPKPPIP